jgi:DNA-binding transcriptional ArsR family regulator
MNVPSNGVATSNRAAASVKGHTARMRAKVLRSLRRRPNTCDAIERNTGLRHQTASARIYELRAMGLVVDTGERRPTRSGRLAIVWAVKPAGASAVTA